MAIIVEQHVVADMYVTADADITAGNIVSLNGAGAAVRSPIGINPDVVAVGIAGDTKTATEGQTTAYSDQVTLGASGQNQRWTSNRVSDFYDETSASGKITVYNGGGKFWISEDLFDAAGGITPSTTLGASGATAGEWVGATTDDDIVAVAVGPNQAYQSGVPGTDVQGSISLGNYVPIVLRI